MRQLNVVLYVVLTGKRSHRSISHIYLTHLSHTSISHIYLTHLSHIYLTHLSHTAKISIREVVQRFYG